MVTQDSVVNIPLAGGLDTKTEEKLVQPGSLLRCENGFQQKTGSVRKRNGYTELQSGAIAIDDREDDPELTGIHSLFSINDELVAIGESTENGLFTTHHGPGFFNYAEAEGKWVSSGTYFPCEYTTETITRATIHQDAPTVAQGNGKRVYAYQDGSNPSIRYHILDVESNSILADDITFTSSPYKEPKAIYIEDGYGKNFVLTGKPVTGFNEIIPATIIDTTQAPATENFPATVNLATNFEVGEAYDVDVIRWDGYDVGVMGYQNNNSELELISFTGDGTILRRQKFSDTTNGIAEQGSLCVSAVAFDDDPGNTRVYVAYQDNNKHIQLLVFNSNLDLLGDTPTSYPFDVNGSSAKITISNTTIYTYRNFTIARDSASSVSNLSVVNPTNGYLNTVRLIFDITESSSPSLDPLDESEWFIGTQILEYDGFPITSSPKLRYGITLASKAFFYNNHCWVLLSKNSGTQATYFLSVIKEFRFTQPIFVAKAFYGSAGGYTDNGLSAVVSEGGGRFTIAGTKIRRIINNNIRERNIVGLNFNLNPDPMPSVQVGRTAIIGGGILGAFDGRFMEHGFHLIPENLRVDSTSTSGGELADGYYSWQQMWSYIDRNGEQHRSGVSAAIGSQVEGIGNNDSVSLITTQLNITDYDNKGTLANILFYRTLRDGSVYHRLDRINNTVTPTARTFLPTTFSLSVDDSEINQNEIIYTQSGEIPASPPPASVILAARNNRVFLVPMDDREAIWYSKPKVETIAVEFAEEFQLRIPKDGPNTALAVLDDKVIVFKENAIYYFAGDGPNALGQGSFSPIRPVQTDVGCIDRNSVINIGSGVMFKSRRGIYLLNRSLQVQYIGAPVEEWNRYKILDAQLLRDRDQVRFLLEKGRGVLVYDFYHSRWTHFTNHAAADSTMHLGRYHYALPNGKVRRENDGWVDVSFQIPLRVETPWIKVGGIQNFQRVKRMQVLGNYRSSHTLNCEVYTDYDDSTPVQTRSWTSSESHTPGEPLQYELHLKRQKCQAIKFVFWDTHTSQTHESYTLEGISLWVGLKTGLNKLPDRKTK